MFMRGVFGVIACAAAVLLTACGGGGDRDATADQLASSGQTSSSSNSARPAALLYFGTGSLTANVQQGTSATLTTRATSSNPLQFGSKLYALVVDDAGVLMSYVRVVPLDDTSVSVTVHPRVSMRAGRYQGVAKVQLCYDPECAMLISGESFDLPYDITVAEKPLVATVSSGVTNATVHRGGVVPSSVSVNVYNASEGWTATSSTAWLKVIGGTGRGAGSFTVIFEPLSLLEGAYSATVTVKGVDGQQADLPFSLEVLPTSFVIKNNIPTFTAVNGAPISAQSLWFDLDNGMTSGWTVSSSAEWLRVNALSGSTPALVTLQPDPSRGALASGAYEAEIQLSSGATASNKTVKAVLNLTKPGFSASSAILNFGGERGRQLNGNAGLTFSLNTGINAWPYTVTQMPAWLTTSTASGTVGQSGAALSFTTIPQNIKTGTSSSRLMVTAQVNGDEVTMPVVVNVNADQRRLLASEWGVAFTSSPAGTMLQRSVEIRDNFEQGLRWTATSDVPWLTVTASGNTAESQKLNLQANAANLPMDTVSYANVTVRSDAAGVESAVIRVAVWRSASAPFESRKVASQGYTRLVADKIRPYVYASRASAIDIFNVYTGALVATMPSPGKTPDYMAVSADGSKLYAMELGRLNVMEFDLVGTKYVKAWALQESVWPPNIQTIKVNGVDIVFLGNGKAYSGEQLTSGFAGYGFILGTPDGRKMFSGTNVQDVDYSAISGGTLFKSAPRYINTGASGDGDYAINSDGSRVYFAGSMEFGYGCGGGDTATGKAVLNMQMEGGFPINVEVTRDGRVLCGIEAFTYGDDLFMAKPDGSPIRSWRVAGSNNSVVSGQLVVTPDGFGGAALTNDPFIVFLSLAP